MKTLGVPQPERLASNFGEQVVDHCSGLVLVVVVPAVVVAAPETSEDVDRLFC